MSFETITKKLLNSVKKEIKREEHIDTINNDINPEIFYSNKHLVKKLCSRNFGIGSDGIILLLPSIYL